MQAAGLIADGFELLVELDGVTLQRCHIGVGIEGMEAARRMPGGPGSQLRSLDQQHVLPAELGEVIQNAATDDAAPDDGNLHVGLHATRPSVTLAANPA